MAESGFNGGRNPVPSKCWLSRQWLGAIILLSAVALPSWGAEVPRFDLQLRWHDRVLAPQGAPRPGPTPTFGLESLAAAYTWRGDHDLSLHLGLRLDALGDGGGVASDARFGPVFRRKPLMHALAEYQVAYEVASALEVSYGVWPRLSGPFAVYDSPLTFGLTPLLPRSVAAARLRTRTGEGGGDLYDLYLLQGRSERGERRAVAGEPAASAYKKDPYWGLAGVFYRRWEVLRLEALLGQVEHRDDGRREREAFGQARLRAELSLWSRPMAGEALATYIHSRFLGSGAAPDAIRWQLALRGRGEAWPGGSLLAGVYWGGAQWRAAGAEDTLSLRGYQVEAGVEVRPLPGAALALVLADEVRRDPSGASVLAVGKAKLSRLTRIAVRVSLASDAL